MTGAVLRDIFMVIVAVLLSGYYSGSEMAAYSLNRARLRLLRLKGHHKAQWLGKMVQDRPEAFIAMILVANNIVNYLASLYMTRLFSRGYPQYAEYYATAVLVPILFLFGESTPKSIMVRHADAFMYRTTGFLRLTTILLKPLTLPLEWLQRLLVSGPGRRQRSYFEFSRSRVHQYLLGSAAQGELADLHGHITENVIALREKTVRDVRIPLNRVATLRDDFDYDTVERMARQYTYRRLPVVKDGEVLGVVNVVEALLDGPDAFDKQESIRDIPTISEDKSVFYALQELRRARTHLAASVTGDGQVTGLVWVKDLVQMVVGELRTW